MRDGILLTLVLLSIVVFALLGPLPIFWRLVTRILFIPILAGIASELARLRESMSIALSMRQLFEAPTIAALAAAVDRKLAAK